MDRQQKKELGIIIATTFYTTFLFSVISFLSGTLFNGTLVGLLIAASVVWVALLALGLALIKSAAMASVFAAVTGATIAITGGFGIGPAVGGLLAALLIIAAYGRIMLEVSNRIKYNTVHVFYGGTKLIILAFMLAVAGLYVGPLVGVLKVSGIQIPTSTIQLVLAPLDTVMSASLPAYSGDVTVDELIEQRVRQQAGSNTTAINAQQLELARRQISEELGQSLSGRETFPILIANRVNRQLSELTTNQPFLAAVIIIILTVGLLRAIVPLFAWITVGVIAFFVMFNQRIGWIYLNRTQQIVERLQL